MKFKYLLLCCFIFKFSTLIGQNKFKQGYLVLENGTQTTGYILDLDWKNNPTNIEFKKTLSEDSRHVEIEELKEFGIANEVKFMRYQVDLDRSSNQTQKLSVDRNPTFNNETLFLKVLVEGDATLFSYKDQNLTRFFYTLSDETPQQLVHKKYLTPTMKAGVNDLYKQQLKKDLACEQVKLSTYENLSYTKNSLISLFEAYHACVGSTIKRYGRIKEKTHFEFALFAGLQASNLEFSRSNSSLLDTDFDSKMSPTFGFEAALSLPFNNNKWLIYIRPSYNTYNTEKEITLIDNGTQTSTANVIADLNWIAVPIGFKHNLYIDESSNFTIRGGIVFSVNLNSSVYAEGRRSLIDIETGYKPAFTLGVGYTYAKFSLSFDYVSPQEIAKDDDWDTSLNRYSFTLSYQFL